MIIRELLAKFGVQYDNTGAKKADAGIANLVSAAKGLVGIFGGQAIVRGMASFMEEQIGIADAVGDAADAMGVGVGALQELRFAAKRFGVDAGTVDMSLKKFGMTMSKAAGGSAEAGKTFKALGITLKDSSGKMRPIDDVLMDVAESMSHMDNAQDQLRVGQELFGRAGGRFVGMLKQGKKGLEDVRARARELGIVLSKEQADAFGVADDAVGDYDAAIGALKQKIAAHLLPTFKQFTDRVSELIPKLGWFISHSHILEAGIAAVGTAFAVAFGGQLAAVAAMAAGVVLVALAIDDIVNWAGKGDSVLGRFLDKLGGKGTSIVWLDTMRAGWVVIGKEVSKWVENLKVGWDIMGKTKALEDQKKYEKDYADYEVKHDKWERDQKAKKAGGWTNAFPGLTALAGEDEEPRAPGKPSSLAVGNNYLRTRQESKGRAVSADAYSPEDTAIAVAELAAARAAPPQKIDITLKQEHNMSIDPSLPIDPAAMARNVVRILRLDEEDLMRDALQRYGSGKGALR